MLVSVHEKHWSTVWCFCWIIIQNKTRLLQWTISEGTFKSVHLPHIVITMLLLGTMPCRY
jgi:hypothetical protein